MNDRAKYALGWLCYQVVMLLPVTLRSPAYCWLLGWAGYYANDSRHVARFGRWQNGRTAMKNVQMLRAKTYHMAAKVNNEGGVSALCFTKPHPIDLSRALWTIVPSAVTCAKCKALMRLRTAASITSVEVDGDTMTIESRIPDGIEPSRSKPVQGGAT